MPIDAPGLDGDRAVAAVLFMQSSMIAMDTMSALNSSPWTSENFGADPAKAATARGYVAHSLMVSGGLSVLSATIAQSWWPIVGMVVTNVYLYWIYERALGRATASGSTDWAGR